MSLRAMAEKLGFTAAYLCDIEHGRRIPSDLGAFAKVLRVSVEDLEDRCGRVDRKTLEFIKKHPEVAQYLRQKRTRCRCSNCVVVGARTPSEGNEPERKE